MESILPEFDSGSGPMIKHLIEKVVTDNIFSESGAGICSELRHVPESYLKCDIREWQPLVDLFNTTFVGETMSIESGSENNYNFVSTALVFLKRLLVHCYNKRYFLAFEGLEHLLSSKSSHIVVLAVDVLHEYMRPCRSPVPMFEETSRPQLPKSLLQKLSVLVTGLSFSASNYGVIEYLQGHLPNMSASEEITISFTLPSSFAKMRDPRKGPSVVDITINLSSATNTLKCFEELSVLLPSSHQKSRLCLLASIRAAGALHGGSITSRIDIMLLKLKSLYVLLSSNEAMDCAEDYLNADSPLFKDIFKLANMATPSMFIANKELNILALECISVMVKSEEQPKVIRMTTQYPWLPNLIGVDVMASDVSGEQRQQADPPWLSILNTAAIMASSQLQIFCQHQQSDSPVDSSLTPLPIDAFSFFPPAPPPAAQTSGVVETSIEYFYSALHLFGCVMSLNVDDINCAAATSVLRMFLDSATALMAKSPSDLSSAQVMLLVKVSSRVFETICYLDELKDNFLKVFGEAGGTACLINFLDMFPSFYMARVRLRKVSGGDFGLEYEKCVTFALTLLSLTVSSAHSSTRLTDRNVSIQYINRSSFSDLCTLICDEQKAMRSNLSLVALCDVFREAIDADPAFLSQFIGASGCGLAKNVITALLGDVSTGSFSPLLRKQNCYVEKEKSVFLAGISLAASMCITAAGRQFLKYNNVCAEVIGAMLRSMHVFPSSEGIPHDELVSIGNLLGDVMKSHEELQRSITLKLRDCIERLSRDFEINGENSADSCKQAATHKINYICTIIENLVGGENRRGFEAVLKSIFADKKLISSLLQLYRQTLPGGRQLLCQVSVHNNWSSAAVHYGNGSAAKAITNVLKLAISVCAADVIPPLLVAVDKSISDIVIAKNNLIATSAIDTESKEKSEALAAGSGKSSSESKTVVTKLLNDMDSVVSSGLLLEPGSLLGVLDLFPERCIFDRKPSLGDLAHSEKGLQKVPPVLTAPSENAISILLSKTSPRTPPRTPRTPPRSPSRSTGNLGYQDATLTPRRPGSSPSSHSPARTDENAVLYNSGIINAHTELSTECERASARFIFAILHFEWLSWIVSHCLQPARAHDRQQVIAMQSSSEVVRRLLLLYKTSLLETCRFSSQKWTANSTSVDNFNDLTAGGGDIENDNKDRCPAQYVLRVVVTSGALIRENCEIEGSRIVRVVPCGAILTAFERRTSSGGVIRYRCQYGWLSEFHRDHSRMPIVEVVDLPCDSQTHEMKLPKTVPDMSCTESAKTIPGQVRAMTLREAACYSLTRVQSSLRLVIVNLARGIANSYGGPTASRLALDAAILASFLSSGIKDILLHPFEVNSSKVGRHDGEYSDSDGAKINSEEKAIHFYQTVKRNCIYFGAVFKNIISPLIEDRTGHINAYLMRKLLADSVDAQIIDCFSYVKSILFGISCELISSGSSRIHNGARNCATISMLLILSVLGRILKKDGYAVTHSEKYFFENDANISKTLGRNTSSSINTLTLLLTGMYNSFGNGLLPHFKEYDQMSRLPFEIQARFIDIVKDIVQGLFEYPTNNFLISVKSSVQSGTSDLHRHKSHIGQRMSPESLYFGNPTTGMQDIMQQLLVTMGYPTDAVSEVLATTTDRNLNNLMERLNSAATSGDFNGSPDSPTLNEPEVVSIEQNSASAHASLPSPMINIIAPVLDAGGPASASEISPQRFLAEAIPSILNGERATMPVSDDGPPAALSSCSDDELTSPALNADRLISSYEICPQRVVMGSPSILNRELADTSLSDDAPPALVSSSSSEGGSSQDMLRALELSMGNNTSTRPVPSVSRKDNEPSLISPLTLTQKVGNLILGLTDSVGFSRFYQLFCSEENDNFKLLMDTIQYFRASLLSACLNMHHASEWRSQENVVDKGPQLLGAEFCLFIQHVMSMSKLSILQAPTENDISGVKKLISSKYLIDFCFGEITTRDNKLSSFGSLHMLLSMLQNKSTQEYVFEMLSREKSKDLIASILSGIKLVSNDSLGTRFMCWIAPALLICRELVVSPYSISQSNENIAESKEETVQQESKTTDEGSLDVFEALEKNISRGVLIDDALCSSILADLLSMFLSKDSDSSRLFGNGTSIIHAFLLLLSDLLSRQSVAMEFVEGNGMERLLALQHFADFDKNTALLTEIVSKCLQIRPVLKSRMIEDIRKIFQTKRIANSTSPNSNKMLLATLLSECSSLIAIDIPTFMKAVSETVDFKVEDPQSKSGDMGVLVHVAPMNSNIALPPNFRPDIVTRHLKSVCSFELEERIGYSQWPQMTFAAKESFEKVRSTLHGKSHSIRNFMFTFRVERHHLVRQLWVQLKENTDKNGKDSISVLSIPGSDYSSTAMERDAQRALKTISPLLDMIFSHLRAVSMREKKDVQMNLAKAKLFGPSEALHALTAAVLFCRTSLILPNILSMWAEDAPVSINAVVELIRRGSTATANSPTVISGSNLSYLLLMACLKPSMSTKIISGDASSEWVAFQTNAVRYIVAMSTFSGAPRSTLVYSLIQILPNAYDGRIEEVYGNLFDDLGTSRMSFFYKLCRLLVLVVTPTLQSHLSSATSRNVAYIDALTLLVTCNVPQSLVDILFNIDLSHSKLDDTVLEATYLLEKLTYPQLIRNLAASQTASNEGVNEHYGEDSVYGENLSSVEATHIRVEHRLMPSFNVRHNNTQAFVENHANLGADESHSEDDESNENEDEDDFDEAVVAGEWPGGDNEDTESDDEDDIEENGEEEVYEDQAEDFPMFRESRTRLVDDDAIPSDAMINRHLDAVTGNSSRSSGDLIVFDPLSASRPRSRHVPRRRYLDMALADLQLTPAPYVSGFANVTSFNDDDTNDFGVTATNVLMAHPAFITPPDMFPSREMMSYMGRTQRTDMRNDNNMELQDIFSEIMGSLASRIPSGTPSSRYDPSANARRDIDELETFLRRGGMGILAGIENNDRFEFGSAVLAGQAMGPANPQNRLNHPLLVPVNSIQSPINRSSRYRGGSGLDAFWGDELDYGYSASYDDVPSIIADHNYGPVPFFRSNGFPSPYQGRGMDMNIMSHEIASGGSRDAAPFGPSMTLENGLERITDFVQSSVMDTITRHLEPIESQIVTEDDTNSNRFIVELRMCEGGAIPDVIQPNDVVAVIIAFQGIRLTPITSTCEAGSLCWKFSCASAEDCRTVSAIDRMIIRSNEVRFSSLSVPGGDSQAGVMSNSSIRSGHPQPGSQAASIDESDQQVRRRRRTIDSGDLADTGTIDSDFHNHPVRVSSLISPARQISTVHAVDSAIVAGGFDGDESIGFSSDITSQYEGDTEAQHPRVLLQRPVRGTNLRGYVVSTNATVNTNISDMTREIVDADVLSTEQFEELESQSRIASSIAPIEGVGVPRDPESGSSSGNSSPLSSLSFVSHQESLGNSVVSVTAVGLTPRGRGRVEQSLSATSRVPEDEEGIIFDGATIESAFGNASNEEIGDDEPRPSMVSEEHASIAVEPLDSSLIVNLENAGIAEGPTATVTTDATSSGLACPAGYDVDVFNSLPEFMQREVIEQASADDAGDDTEQLLNSAGYDMETVMSLPENIRREIVDQIRRERQDTTTGPAATATAASSTPGEDNIAFLLSLPPELRAEVLLTSEPEFMQSLTPDLIAEANRLRDNMAIQFQTHEVGNIDQDEEDNDMEEEEENIELEGAMHRADSLLRHARYSNGRESFQAGRRFGVDHSRDRNSSALDQKIKNPRTKPGFLSIRDRIVDAKVSIDVIKLLIKLLYVEKLPVQVSILKQIWYNITRHDKFRDIAVRLLVSLLSSNCLSLSDFDVGSQTITSLPLSSTSQIRFLNWLPKDMIPRDRERKVVEDPGGSDGGAETTVDYFQVHLSHHSPYRGRKMTAQCVASVRSGAFDNLLDSEKYNSVSADGALSSPIPQPVLKRILGILKFLVSMDEGTVYEFLRPRAGSLGAAYCEESSPSLMTRNGISNKGDGNTLLESLMNSFHAPMIEESSLCLESVAKLIETISLYIAESEPTVEGTAGASENEKEIKGASDMMVETPANVQKLSSSSAHGKQTPLVKAEICNGEVTDKDGEEHFVEIPKTQLSLEALQSLSGALILENCSTSAFEHIAAAINHLSKIDCHRNALRKILKDVVKDLASQSNRKLQEFIDSRRQSSRNRSRKNTFVSKEFSSISGDNGSDMNPMLTGDIGGSEHEKLFRTLNILNSISSKKSKDDDSRASDQSVANLPVGDIILVWGNLHETLNLLEEELGDSGGETALTLEEIFSPVLLSSLVKLLPLVKLFFSIYSTNLRLDAEIKTVAFNPTVEKITLAPVGEGIGESVAQSTPVPLGPPSLLQRVQSIPGAKYRNGPEFRERNVLLHLDSSSESSPALRTAISFRRSNSAVGKVSSSNFLEPNTSDGMRLLSFVHAHRKSLNLLIQRFPEYLQSGPLSVLIKVVQLRTNLSFQNKTKYFFTELRKIRDRGRRAIHMQVRRDFVFEDSFQALRSHSISDWRGRLSITFHGEEGIDAGGLTREWYQVLAREMFNPNYALFTAVGDGATFQPNPLSNINMNHLDYFKFVGRVVGKALVDGHLMDAHFTRSFYKHVLGIPVDYTDIEALEPDYFKSLKQIMEYSLEDLGLELTFSADVQLFGKHEVVDLVPGGRKIIVTDATKAEYIRLVAHHRMTTAIRSQIDSFLQGFYDLVPAELISIFTPTELELLICGLPDVNIEDLKANTDYSQFRATDDCIIWFWEILRDFSSEEKALFLQFVTGTSKVPLSGFSGLQGIRGPQRFSVHRSYADPSALPTAHTCFNQLDLPAYATKEDLHQKLLLAIREGSEGFGFS